MVCLVSYTVSLQNEKALAPSIPRSSPGSFRERGNFVCERFLPGLSCSFPLQQKQQAAAKCSVNGSIHTVRESEGGREGGGEQGKRKEKEGGGSSEELNNKMPHWTLAPHTNLSLERINCADWRWWWTGQKLCEWEGFWARMLFKICIFHFIFNILWWVVSTGSLDVTCKWRWLTPSRLESNKYIQSGLSLCLHQLSEEQQNCTSALDFLFPKVTWFGFCHARQ